MEKFNLSNEAMQQLDAIRRSLMTGENQAENADKMAPCTTCWGGTYNLIFDLNCGLKKSHKKGWTVTMGDVPPQTEPQEASDSSKVSDE